jgi:hypothetical protein
MTLKEFVLHQMAEARREMIEAVKGLSPGELSSMDPAGHWPVAWVMEHCTLNADFFLHVHMTGKYVLEHEDRYKGWPMKEPEPGDIYPDAEKLIERWTILWDAVIPEFSRLEESVFSEKLHGREPLIESCLRVINHVNAHLRSIWCILGEKRIDSKFPEQQKWLA